MVVLASVSYRASTLPKDWMSSHREQDCLEIASSTNHIEATERGKTRGEREKEGRDRGEGGELEREQERGTEDKPTTTNATSKRAGGGRG